MMDIPTNFAIPLDYGKEFSETWRNSASLIELHIKRIYNSLNISNDEQLTVIIEIPTVGILYTLCESYGGGLHILLSDIIPEKHTAYTEQSVYIQYIDSDKSPLIKQFNELLVELHLNIIDTPFNVSEMKCHKVPPNLFRLLNEQYKLDTLLQKDMHLKKVIREDDHELDRTYYIL